MKLLKKITVVIILPLLYVFLFANSVYAVTRTSPLIIDHTNVDQFNSLSSSQIQAAAAKRVYFVHASTGEKISVDGLNRLGTPYDRSKWYWPFYTGTMDPGNGGLIASSKIEVFPDFVSQVSSNYDVFGMKFCYLDWWGQDFTAYKNMMESLETNVNYQNKYFIWATSAVAIHWVEDPQQGSIITEFNQQLRSYARTHNKILYDIADIESHHANGTACFSNIETLCDEYYSNDGSNGHPGEAGSLRLAKAFWVLMGNLTSDTLPTSEVPTNTPHPSVTPPTAPILGDLDNNGVVNMADFTILKANFGNSNCQNIANLVGKTAPCKVNIFDFAVLLANYGK